MHLVYQLLDILSTKIKRSEDMGLETRARVQEAAFVLTIMHR